jgi:hypothetical protein
VQAVECLLGKYEALSSNPSPPKKKKNVKSTLGTFGRTASSWDGVLGFTGGEACIRQGLGCHGDWFGVHSVEAVGGGVSVCTCASWCFLGSAVVRCVIKMAVCREVVSGWCPVVDNPCFSL